MFGLGFPELLIILVIILVIFGAGKLPQVGEALGKGLSKFRNAMDDKPEPGEPVKAVSSDDADQEPIASADTEPTKKETTKS